MKVKWTKIKTIKDLPPEGLFVLAVQRSIWGRNAEDLAKRFLVVLRVEKGLSKKDREHMDDCDRKRTFCTADEADNNLVPWYWHGDGPMGYFGQEVTHWVEVELPQV